MESFAQVALSGDSKHLKDAFAKLSTSERQHLSPTDTAKLAVFLASSMDGPLLNELLQASFGADYVSDTGETALHKAVKAHLVKNVELLLATSSCNPNASDGHQQTALHRSCEFGFEKCIHALISDPRVNIDAEDAWSRTALHWTVEKYARFRCPESERLQNTPTNLYNPNLRRGFLELTKILLERGAKALTTVTKETPLQWAVRGGHKNLIELLLKHHPELSVYSYNDRMETPIDMARTQGYLDIVELLWEHAQAHGQVPATLNTVVNESQVHDTGVKIMSMKPKGGVRKLTIKRHES